MPTNPGINDKFPLRDFNQDEQSVIFGLALSFYVTKPVTAIPIGNSSYNGFLMRPAEAMAIYLNSERELMVLLSQYDTFEARTFEAYDRILNQLEEHRVDKTVRFLVSNDNDIDAKIRLFLQKEPEYPIVIPMKFSQFKTGSQKAALSAAIQSHYKIRDLFGLQAPLQQEYFFFGRKELVNLAIDAHKSRQNSTLFGLRKSGKTSTINAIKRRAKASGVVSVSFDCEDTEFHGKRFGRLLQYIANGVRVNCGLSPMKEAWDDAPDEISARFKKAMVDTLSAIGKNVLLVFDEIENISPETAASSHWTTGVDTLYFWQILRAFFQQQGKQYITFCFVGTNPKLFETQRFGDVANPVYLFAPRTFLGNLSRREVGEMLDRLGFFMGLEFDEGIKEMIYVRYGGHPFFIRQACSEIHKGHTGTRPFQVTRRACEIAFQSIFPSIKGYMQDVLLVLKKFYPEEYEMLEYLASSDVEAFNSIAQKYPEMIEHAIGYGLISRRETEYYFNFGEIEQAILRSAPRIMNLEEIRGEIMKRRNRIEEEIRVQLFFWSQRVGRQVANDVCVQCFGKDRFDRVQGDFRLLFGRRNSPLYIVDLIKILKETDVCRENPRAYGALDIVNKFRIDAHAKDISQSELLNVSDALSVLEDIFVAP